MILRIKYKKFPKFCGFRFPSSTLAVSKGEDAETKELKASYKQHMQRFQQYTQLFGKKCGSEKIKREDVDAWIEDGAGTKIETIA